MCGHTIHTHLLYIWVGQETTQTYIAHLRPAHSQAGRRDPSPWAMAGRTEDLSMAGSHVRGKKQTGQAERTRKKNRHTGALPTARSLAECRVPISGQVPGRSTIFSCEEYSKPVMFSIPEIKEGLDRGHRLHLWFVKPRTRGQGSEPKGHVVAQ